MVIKDIEKNLYLFLCEKIEKENKLMVFKIEKTKNYTVMSNYHLRDKNLSLKAKGLLSFMLSLPEDWDYSLNGLVSINKESKKAIRNVLNELKENGYLVVEQTRGERGQYKYNYIIYEVPEDKIKEKNLPDTQKGDTVKGDAEKDTQINTKIISKEEQDKLDKTLNSFTRELIKRDFISITDLDIYRYNELFNELLQDYDYKDLCQFTSYILKKWNEIKGLDEEGNEIQNQFAYFKSSMLNNIDKLKNPQYEWDDELGWFISTEEDFTKNNLYDEDIEYEID